VFKLNPDGNGYRILHSFGGSSDGWYLTAGLAAGADAALYGTTHQGGAHSGGTIFTLNPDGSGYNVLYDFGGTVGDGLWPSAALAIGSDGAFYGTTSTGGDSDCGTVFKLWPPETPDMIGVALTGRTALVSLAGTAGYQYRILRSADLSHWLALGTITMPSAGNNTFPDNSLTNSAAWYRAAWVP
jgi:uncharacterized repeat protein (TIGR03803 family)